MPLLPVVRVRGHRIIDPDYSESMN